MSPHELELELVLFINKNFLSPSIFDKVMKWAHSATANGYKFDSPSYSTLGKKLNVHSPILLMVVLSNLRWSFYQKRLDQTSQWQCGTLRIPLELPAKSLWDPQVMKDFVCFAFPRGNILIVDHMCTTRLLQLTGSMKHSTIHLPLKSGMLQPSCLFDDIRHFDDSSNTDCLMRNSEYLFLQNILDLTLECCQSSDSWMLMSILPDLEVSDLKKSQSNPKSNGDILSLCCLKLYHKCSEYLYSAFKDPNQYYDLWVHCIAWFWLDASLLSSGYDHRWYRGTQKVMWLPWRKWLT